ncbi:hypothetical protein [Erysipelothrix aquatica]|uniref:hypothetical protein n=1 Tax=Erysipelothrix aquatica TaxID=2683714 RepID=UPI0013589DC8|nr:hypothetical protein [Erysipelothrix aquatica]
MKKIFKITLIAIVLAFATIPVFAASVFVSINRTTVSPGDTITITVGIDDPEGLVQADFGTTGGISSPNGNRIVSRGNSDSLSFVANSSGRISVTGFGEDLDGTKYPVNRIFDITVENSTSEEGDGDESTESGSGGHTGGVGNGSSNSGSSSTPDKNKNPEQLAEEKAAEEAKAKEDAQKNPLISSFNIISNNEKKFGETLSDIPTAVDTWEYEYKLPKRIDSVLLDVKSVSETTTLTFDKEQKFAEGEKTKDIVIRAVDGEITQEYKLKLTRDDSEPVKVNVGDKTATLYDDEALDKLMTEYGFTKEAIDQNGTASFAYQKDAMKLQLLTDEKQNAQWLALDKTNAAKTVVYPVLQDEGKMYLLTAPNPEMAKQTYGGVAVTPKDLDFKKFEGVDSSLKFDKQVSVWNLEGESGMIVNGMQTTDSEPRLYHLDNTQKLTPAFVAFDVTSSKTTKVWAITATVVAVALAAGFGAYLYVNRAPKKRKDVNI